MKNTSAPGRWGRVLLAAVLLAAPVTVGGSGFAVAATTTNYASWAFDGSTTAYTGTVGQATGFPTVTLVSTSRTPPSPPIATGASVWLPPGTPFADLFGSSQNQPYLNLRPQADNPTSPSTTTYTFGSPTPVGTWGVNFGDLDAEILTIAGLDATGQPVSAADLGVQAPYNYCDATPRSSSCSGLTAPYPVPTSTATPSGVTVQDPLCPADSLRCDTQGASIWLLPQVPLSSLTVTSTWKQGQPSYQTWFATARGTATGTVTSDCPLPGTAVVQLLQGGTVVASATADDGGGFPFPALALGSSFQAVVDPASVPGAVTGAPQPVGPLTAAPASFALTLTSGWTVAGSVQGVTADGVDVVLEPAGSGPGRTVRTDGEGEWSIPDVTPGTYLVSPVAGPGARVVPASQTVTVGCADAQVEPFAWLAVPADPSSTTTTSPPTSPPSSPPSSPSSSPPSSSVSSVSSSPALPSPPMTSSPVPPPTTPRVGPAGPNAPGSGGGVLSATGSALVLPAALGLGLLVVGGLVLAAGRRLRHG